MVRWLLMSSPPRILIVEDEPIVAADLSAQLERLNYQPVGRAASGAQAIALAGELRPDLVLMDIRLEGAMDGVEAATERSSHPAVISGTATTMASTPAAAMAGPMPQRWAIHSVAMGAMAPPRNPAKVSGPKVKMPMSGSGCSHVPYLASCTVMTGRSEGDVDLNSRTAAI